MAVSYLHGPKNGASNVLRVQLLESRIYICAGKQ
ncbi:hypothetical protein Alexa_007 [Acinetobacter phage vB_AbaP_Alexa]|nr:hypothetical protein Alexa_007 [Acinetobacter phage vB_AbaP_Alexa]